MSSISKNAIKWLSSLDLKKFLIDAWNEEGFEEPTPVQEKAVPLILEGRDIAVEAPTGTGKTLAYLIPLLQKIDSETKHVQVVILAPSHELAMQISQVITKWTKGSSIKSASFIGGANVKRQKESLKKKPDIIVGTTGRILELIKEKQLKMHEVKTIVVDEFDVLIAQEHADNLKRIIKTTLKERQILFFSATLSERTEEIGKELMQEPTIIQLKREEYDSSNTEHLYFICEQREKIEMLPKILRTGKVKVKALAFLNDINKLSEIEAKLKYNKVNLGVLMGESGKIERKEALEGFRMGKIPLLLATDLAARGLDIEGLTHVINLDLPRNFNQYIHRAGRTGRMGAPGTVISIVTKGEEAVLKKTTKKLGINIKKKVLHMGEIKDSR